MLVPYFRDALAARRTPGGAWSSRPRAGVADARVLLSLAYYDGYRRERGPANLIQGLRDYFGAHTYRRIDRDGCFHTRWGQDGAEVRTDG